MATAADNGNISVFLSNVPNTMTEDDVVELMQRAGRVASIRLMVSQKKTAAPNTLVGFCDFTDAISARTAVSLLNGHVFADGVKLGVKLADRKRDRNTAAAETVVNDTLVEGSSIALRGDPIQVALSNMRVEDLYEAVEQLRVLILDRPVVARQLLASNPQLRYAVGLILQHAGRLPLQLPPEAIFGASVTPAQPAPQAPASESLPGDFSRQALQAIQELSEDELRKLMNLSEAELSRLAPEEAAHLRCLQAEVKRFL